MEKLLVIGQCPKCGKGQIVKGSVGYSCNHFKSMEDKCNFTIYENILGKTITEEIAKELVENKKTKVFDDFKTKEGKIFSASLYIDEDGYIKPKFKGKELEEKCPKCGGAITITSKAYACENIFEKDEEGESKCSFYINKNVAGYELTKEDMSDIINGGSTKFIEEFYSTEGKNFGASLVPDEDWNLKFNLKLTECPKCGGTIRMGHKAYSCSNYKENGCNFTIWRNISGRDIDSKTAKDLIENGQTDTLQGFFTKDKKEISRKLILSEDFQVKMI